MAFKQRYSGQDTHSSNDVHIETDLVSNQAGAEPWDDHDLTVVDGQLTVITDSDDLVGVRFLVIHESYTVTTEDDPAPQDPQVWYSFWCARGPMVFRLISKRTIPPEHDLRIQTWKDLGGTSTNVRWGLNLMLQSHN